jgi:hypothetical protein
VGEDVRDRDAVLPAPAEVGHDLAQRHVEPQDAVADEREAEGRRRELRERREIEDARLGARSVRSGARIGAERARGVRLALAAVLDEENAGGAERADRRVDRGVR